MGSISSHINQGRQVPEPNANFSEAFARAAGNEPIPVPPQAFLPDGSPDPAIEFERNAAEMGARFKETCRRAIFKAFQNEIDMSKDLRIAMNSEDFVNGMRALHILSGQPSGLNEDAERKIRDLVAIGLMKYPDGERDPDFLAEIEQQVRVDFLGARMIDRHSPERVMLDAATEAVSDIDKAILEMRANNVEESIVARFLTKRNELLQTIELCKIPGAFAVNEASSSIEVVDRLKVVLNAEADQNPALRPVAQQVAQVQERLRELYRKKPQPGTHMMQEILELTQMLNTCIAAAEQSGSEDATGIATELLNLRAKVDAEARLLDDIGALTRRNAERLRSQMDSIVGPPPQQGTGQTTYEDRLTPLLDAVNTAVTGQSGDTMVWLRNRMQDVRGRVAQKASLIESSSYREELEAAVEANLDYARTTSSFFSICRGPELGYRSLDARHIQATFGQLTSILERMNPAATADTRGEIASFLQTFERFNDEQLMDAGLMVGSSPDSIRWDYSVRLEEWRGRPPTGQIAVDQMHATLCVAKQLDEIDQAMEREFAALFVRAEREGWEPARLQRECRVVFDDAWSEIIKIRPQVIEVAGQTFERGVVDGIDEHPPLNEEQRAAFALVVEQRYRQDAEKRARYESQRDKEWQLGFEEIPISSLAAERMRDPALAGLSDEELNGRIAAAGESFTVANERYERIAEQVVGRNEEGTPVGYQNLITTLDRVGPDAYRGLEIDFLSSMQRDDRNSGFRVGEEVQIFYRRNRTLSVTGRKVWDETAGYGLREMVDSLNRMATYDMGATLSGISQRMAEFVQRNRQHPQRALMENRAERFLYKYAELFGLRE